MVQKDIGLLKKNYKQEKDDTYPSFLENGLFVTNFQTKADIFNELFVQQCSLNQNNSALPRFISRCNTVLENIEIDPSKVLKIIRSLDSNKAHGFTIFTWCELKILPAFYLFFHTHETYTQQIAIFTQFCTCCCLLHPHPSPYK